MCVGKNESGDIESILEELMPDFDLMELAMRILKEGRMLDPEEYLTETSDRCGAPVHPDIPICSALQRVVRNN